MTRHERYLLRLLLGPTACCLLALALYQDVRVSGSDLVRDRMFLGVRR